MGAIAGIVPRGAGTTRDQLTAAISAMRNGLGKRAPLEGGLGVAYDASVALAHRGGIGPGAEAVLQPLRNERGTLWLVADGEPSNATQLRLELIAAGHRFESGCGSEVILHLYEQDGIGALERLTGSFAFALWDREAHELVLGRDRFGAKPLYLRDGADAFAFASEVRGLATGDECDPTALIAFLTLGYVPEPLTVAASVRAVPPGTLVRVRGTRVRTESFWQDVSVWPTGQRDVDRARFGGLLREAVDAAIAGEEDVSVLVDGSPASTALLALVRPMLGRGLRTHAFRFAGDGEGARSATRASDTITAVAAWFRGEHRDHEVDPTAIAAAFAAAAGGDQPSTGAAFATLATAALRRTGERVWLSGLAAPQLVGDDTARLVSWLWRAGRHGSTGGLTRVAARVLALRRPFGRAAALADWVGPSEAIAPAYLATRSVFAPDALTRLLRPDVVAQARSAFDPAAYVDAHALRPPGPPCVLPVASAQVAIERAVAAVELAGPLMSAALRDADAAAGAQGVALRAPLLDHRLHEWIVMGGAVDDRLPLATLLRASLPPTLFRRLAPAAAPPYDAWLRGDLRPVAEEHLLADDPDGHFRVDAVAGLWKGFLAGRVPWSPVWALVNVRAWLRAQRTRGRWTMPRRHAA
jgi:asparagine synthase (glutamine-hydrolysing)